MSYLRGAVKTNLSAMGFDPGTPYIYCGPGTDGYECRDIPEDGMIELTGCKDPLKYCGVQDHEWPCIDDVEACGACLSSCGGDTTGGDNGGELTEAQLAQVAVIANQCMAETIALSAAGKV